MPASRCLLLLLAVCALERLTVADKLHDVQIGSSCRLRNEAGTCQLLDKCKPVYDELVAGKRPEVVCGYQNSMPIVCCPLGGSSGSSSTSTSTSGPIWDNGSTTSKTIQWDPSMRRAEQMCHEYSKSVYAMIQPPVLAGGNREAVNVSLCAIKSKKLIIGGEKAEPKEFPHMAAIGYSKDNTINWNCGGSLISESWVLTAAHCTYSFQWGYAEYVRVGDLNLNNLSDDAKPQSRRVAQRIRHPNYKRPAQYHDIALLKMDSPVTFDAYVRPACLSLDPIVKPNERTVVSGWGIVDWFDDKGSPNLLKVTLPIISYETCKNYFTNEGSRLPNGVDPKTQLCAGQDGKDTCQGDSGGPLMIYSNSEECMYDVLGVTSFGKLCGSATPGIYMKVSAYVDWIEKIVWP